MCRRLREQARSHRDWGSHRDVWPHRNPIVGVSLLAMAVFQATGMPTGLTPSRAGSLLQGSGYGSGIRFIPDHCGSLPASDGVVSGDRDVECADAFASRPAPTGIVGARRDVWPHRDPIVGVSLLAMAVFQATGMSTGLTPSRAGSLPQGSGGIRISSSSSSTVGAWLARESGGSGSTYAECADAFASRPAPTGIGDRIGMCGLTATPL